MRKQVDKQALFKPEHWDALQAELAVNPTYDVSNVHHVVITHLVLKSMGMTNDAKRREFLARISNGKAKLDVMRSRGRVFAIELLKQLKSNLPDSRSTFRWPRGIEGATGVISNDDIRVSAMTLVPGTDNRSIYANVFFTATPPDNEHNRNNFGRICLCCHLPFRDPVTLPRVISSTHRILSVCLTLLVTTRCSKPCGCLVTLLVLH